MLTHLFVIENVLSLTIKHHLPHKYNTAPQPEILVRTTLVDGFVQIDIIDNGGGVPATISGSIFDKFARGIRGGSNHGAGLGLPISLAIMRAMNGNLILETSADKTTFFRLSLEGMAVR